MQCFANHVNPYLFENRTKTTCIKTENFILFEKFSDFDRPF